MLASSLAYGIGIGLMVSQQGLLVVFAADQTLVSNLRNAGYQVYATDSSYTLIEQATSHHPDAALLHINDQLSPMIESLRLLPGGESLPIVAFGPLDEASMRAALEMGADDYIPADYPPILFVHKIAALIRHAARDSQLRMTLALVERAKQEWEIGVDSLSELVCVLGQDGRVMRTNRTLEAWEIGRVQDVRGRTLSGLLKYQFPTLAKEVDNVFGECWSQLQMGVPFEAELYEPRTDQHFRLQVRPIARNDRHLALTEESTAVAIFEDITARKQSDIALADYAAELEQRNQELDAYGHTVAHDLKSPLNLILGYADMLSTFSPEELAADGVNGLQKIVTSATHMAEMIDQLLLLASTRNATETTKVIEIDPLVTMALARFEYDLLERGIAVEVGTTFPKAVGHAPWVVEIFANLIGNAIKYMGNHNEFPSIRIMGRRMGDYARFEVHDTGVGIEEKDQERLFHMFSRMHPNLAEGTGLGLSIVHRMVLQQNGQVGVESTPNIGSTFWFTLPYDSQDKRG